jgi:hypothetical protein
MAKIRLLFKTQKQKTQKNNQKYKKSAVVKKYVRKPGVVNN